MTETMFGTVTASSGEESKQQS